MTDFWLPKEKMPRPPIRVEFLSKTQNVNHICLSWNNTAVFFYGEQSRKCRLTFPDQQSQRISISYRADSFVSG